MTEIEMKDGNIYTFCIDYDYLFDLLCMLDDIVLVDINIRTISIKAKDIKSMRKVG